MKKAIFISFFMHCVALVYCICLPMCAFYSHKQRHIHVIWLHSVGVFFRNVYISLLAVVNHWTFILLYFLKHSIYSLFFLKKPFVMFQNQYLQFELHRMKCFILLKVIFLHHVCSSFGKFKIFYV